MNSNSPMRMSPRQKMINLMYIVLTAMLALNVSSDVLDGFSQVQEGLEHTTSNVELRNDAVMSALADAAANNPDKAGAWHTKAVEVRRRAAELFSVIDSLKLAIVCYADGDDGDPHAIEHRENIEAANIVMLNPLKQHGANLRNNIDKFRSFITPLVGDEPTRRGIEAILSTNGKTVAGVERPWEVMKFENQPVVAAVALLSKLQNDIMYAEGEALSSLASAIDAGDLRVNELKAFVIPDSRYVMRGNPYRAEIVLAAVDTTARPSVTINGNKLTDGGNYSFVPTSSGSFTYNGYLDVPHPDGSTTRHEFSSDYVVLEPMATVSATMMNVLYAGIDNPIDISVPGIPLESVSATMTNGTLTHSGSRWIARPKSIDKPATINVTVATAEGRNVHVANIDFKVRRLPDPAAYIPVDPAMANQGRYRGGRPLSKAALINAKGINAAIDDGVLDIEFKIIGFETVFFDSMGNAMPEVSDGANFSRRQKDSFRRLSRGKRFYISRIKALGPDGVERTLNPIEITVN